MTLELVDARIGRRREEVGMRSRTSSAVIALGSAAVAAGLVLSLGSSAGATQGGDHKVVICHRTSSETNPYVRISVDVASVDGSNQNEKGGQGDHYLEHQGPVFEPGLKALKIEWGDIIPPIAGVHAGLNWDDAGRAIYDNQCRYRPPASTTTSQPDQDTTTTSQPSEETTTTSQPSEETTTTPPPNEPGEPTSTTTEPGESTTSVASGGPTTPGGGSQVPPSVSTPQGSAGGGLPATGSDSTTHLLALGSALLLTGGAMMALRRRSA